MAVLESEILLRRKAFEVLKQSRETGESVILTRDGKPEVIMLPFEAYVQLRMTQKAESEETEREVRVLEQQAVDTTVCVRNCPFRTPKPGSIRPLEQAEVE